MDIIMKKPQSKTEKSSETPSIEVSASQPAATAAKKTSKAAAVKTPAAEKKAKPAAASPSSDEPAAATTASEAAPKKTSAKPKAPKKAEAAAPALSITERVGLTAGDIWHYLSAKGATPVSTLVTELTEDEKIIQRSIGWLAQEDKITLTTTDGVETIALRP